MARLGKRERQAKRLAIAARNERVAGLVPIATSFERKGWQNVTSDTAHKRSRKLERSPLKGVSPKN